MALAVQGQGHGVLLYRLLITLVCQSGPDPDLIIRPSRVGQRGKDRPKMAVAGVTSVTGEAVHPVTTGRPTDTGPESRALAPTNCTMRTQ